MRVKCVETSWILGSSKVQKEKWEPHYVYTVYFFK